jgi:hypothetical protein
MPTEKITIRAVPGRALPLMHDPKRHLEGEMQVVNHVYYRRAIARGDAELVAPKKEKKS